MRIKGSNQFETKYGLSKDAIISVWMVATFTLLGVIVLPKSHSVSPCPDGGCNSHFIKTVYAKEQKTELQEIAEYIIKKFEPEGRQVAVKALACFISESGLRPDAINVNNDANRTTDAGVAQVNLYWHNETAERMTDWKKNIDKAYQIYKSRGNFSAWYGRGCK